MGRWTETELQFVKANFERGEREILETGLRRPWKRIRKKARELGLQRSKSDTKMWRLLENDSEALYWMGFLLADGNFVVQYNRLQIAVVDYDADHLEAFGKFIDVTPWHKKCAGKPTPGSRDQFCLSASDMFVMPELVSRYGLSNRKTYCPPTLGHLSQEEMIAITIGFIDGDGCIHKRKPPRSDVSGHVTCHSNWLPILGQMSEAVKSVLNTPTKSVPHLKGSGFAVWHLNRKQLKALKTFGESKSLPMMLRKWEVV